MSGMKARWSLALALSPKLVARDHVPLVLCAFRSSSTQDDVLGTLQAAGYSAVCRMKVHVWRQTAP